jgi:hypothetical protein
MKGDEGLAPGSAVLIVDPATRDPAKGISAKVVFKLPAACCCGGAAYHCEVIQTGEHVNFCALMILAPN